MMGRFVMLRSEEVVNIREARIGRRQPHKPIPELLVVHVDKRLTWSREDPHPDLEAYW